MISRYLDLRHPALKALVQYPAGKPHESGYGSSHLVEEIIPGDGFLALQRLNEEAYMFSYNGVSAACASG